MSFGAAKAFNDPGGPVEERKRKILGVEDGVGRAAKAFFKESETGPRVMRVV